MDRPVGRARAVRSIQQPGHDNSISKTSILLFHAFCAFSTKKAKVEKVQNACEKPSRLLSMYFFLTFLKLLYFTTTFAYFHPLEYTL